MRGRKNAGRGERNFDAGLPSQNFSREVLLVSKSME